MNEAKLQKLLKVLEASNEDYASATEVAEIFSVLVGKYKELDDSVKAKIDAVIGNVEQLLQSNSDNTKQEISLLVESLKTEVNRFKSSLPIESNIIQKASEIVTNNLKDMIPEQVVIDENSIIDKAVQIAESKMPVFEEKSIQEIRNELESLKGDQRLDKSAIKGLDSVIGQSELDRAIEILDRRTQYLINKPSSSGSGGGGTWGSITGTLSDQTDLQSALDALVPYTGATADLDLGSYEVKASALHANSSAGVHIHNTSGSDIALFGAGGGTGVTFYDGVQLNAQTASTIAGFDASKNITSLSTATYPSLTELSYVKGVTSAIQTQLNSIISGYVPYTGATTNIDLGSNSITALSGANFGQGSPTGYNDVPNASTFTTTYPNVTPSSIDGYANSYAIYFLDDGAGLLIDQSTLLPIGTVNYATGAVDTTGYASDVIDEFNYTYTPYGLSINSSGQITSVLEVSNSASGYDYVSGGVKFRSSTTASKIWYNLGSAGFPFVEYQGVQAWKNGWYYTSFTRTSNPSFGGDNTQSNLISISKGTSNEGAWLYRLKDTGGISFQDVAQLYSDGIVIAPAFDTPYGQPEAPLTVLNSRFYASRPNAIFKAFSGQSANLSQWRDSSGNVLSYFDNTGNLGLNDKNIILSATTGTKIGTATTQKLAFYNSTPIVQPANTVALETLLVNLGLRASGGTANFDTLITGNAGATINGADLTVNSSYNIKTSDNKAVLSSYWGVGIGSGSLYFTNNSSVFSGGDWYLTRSGTNEATISSDGTTGAANLKINGKTLHGAPANLKNYTVATLPVGVRGDIAYVTDALAPTFLATIVGGGSIVTPVFFDGTNWVAY